MDYPLIFYGSLMDGELVKEVCRFNPIKIEMGLIKGTLFEVTDHTEPNGIYKYPLAVLGDSGELIIAKLNVFPLNLHEFAEMRICLIDFEGPLFEPVQTTLRNFDNQEREGLVFVAKAGLRLDRDTRIKRLSSTLGVYFWNKGHI